MVSSQILRLASCAFWLSVFCFIKNNSPIAFVYYPLQILFLVYKLLMLLLFFSFLFDLDFKTMYLCNLKLIGQLWWYYSFCLFPFFIYKLYFLDICFKYVLSHGLLLISFCQKGFSWLNKTIKCSLEHQGS